MVYVRLTVGKYPNVKTLSRLVFPQAPSPMITSFLRTKFRLEKFWEDGIEIHVKAEHGGMRGRYKTSGLVAQQALSPKPFTLLGAWPLRRSLPGQIFGRGANPVLGLVEVRFILIA